MQHGKKLWLNIAAAILIGLLVAYVGVGISHVTRPCTPAQVLEGEPTVHCKSIEKVYMHPRDLLSNKQGRLVHFSETFAAASVTSFVLLSILGRVHKKQQP